MRASKLATYIVKLCERMLGVCPVILPCQPSLVDKSCWNLQSDIDNHVQENNILS